jgi:N-acetylglucosaminyl-diphospho-decaprenol L-rhamnosyltransferase
MKSHPIYGYPKMTRILAHTAYDLAVIVINYRTPELTVDCLKSVSAEIRDMNACTVLVDNNSADGSIDKIEWQAKNLGLGDSLVIYRSPTNGGFSAGNNLGINAVQADFYLLTNSDTIIRHNAIKTLLETAKNNEKIGLLAPRLEWLDSMPQESCFNYHTPASELIGAAKTGLLTKLLKNYVVAQSVSELPCHYSWVSFASVMIRAKVFADIGLMDEGYFMYYEDVEFCYRAKKSGWEILYEPSAHVVHLRGGSSSVKTQAKLRKRLPRYYYESRTRYFFQLYGRTGLLLANLLWMLGWAVSSLRAVLSSSYTPDVSEKQWRDIWINFLCPLKPYIHPDKYGKKA